MGKASIIWGRGETLVALRVYCSLPFGRLDQRSPEVIRVAGLIGRTPSAVAMKACNLASLDPSHQGRGVSGLGNCSKLDREIWGEFKADSERIAAEAEGVYQGLVGGAGTKEQVGNEEFVLPAGETEREASVKVRRVQGFFRKAVMVSYDNKCAMSGVGQRELLIASHIIPWRVDKARRADPTNGILLNSFYDKAFDAGFITFDDDYRMVASAELRAGDVPEFVEFNVVRREGQRLELPNRFRPDGEAMGYHRESVFRG